MGRERERGRVVIKKKLRGKGRECGEGEREL